MKKAKVPDKVQSYLRNIKKLKPAENMIDFWEYITYSNILMKDQFDPKELLSQFDQFLDQKGVIFEAVVIGSSPLNIIGFIQRQTVDIDVLDPKIPERILLLADEFRVQMQQQGIYLIKNWINNGLDSLKAHLPKNWQLRTKPFFNGKAIQLSTLGRPDLLKDKLWGFCDLREQDKSVILSLKPSKKELLEAAD